jgi:hypothetical protein
VCMFINCDMHARYNWLTIIIYCLVTTTDDTVVVVTMLGSADWKFENDPKTTPQSIGMFIAYSTVGEATTVSRISQASKRLIEFTTSDVLVFAKLNEVSSDATNYSWKSFVVGALKFRSSIAHFRDRDNRNTFDMFKCAAFSTDLFQLEVSDTDNINKLETIVGYPIGFAQLLSKSLPLLQSSVECGKCWWLHDPSETAQFLHSIIIETLLQDYDAHEPTSHLFNCLNSPSLLVTALEAIAPTCFFIPYSFSSESQQRSQVHVKSKSLVNTCMPGDTCALHGLSGTLRADSCGCDDACGCDSMYVQLSLMFLRFSLAHFTESLVGVMDVVAATVGSPEQNAVAIVGALALEIVVVTKVANVMNAPGVMSWVGHLQ